MGIRKKIFLITAASMLAVLLLSYAAIYFYFYHSIFQETMINQRTNVELNRRMADNFLESIYQTAVQLVSDKALGEYLSEDGEDPMDSIRARLAIQDQFAHYATHQVVNSTYYYRNTLFLSDLLPIADSFEAYTLNDNPYVASNSVFSNSRVKEEDWYQETVKNNIYVFLNEATDEICIARKITNTYYIGPYDSNGTAVMVVSVASSQIENVLSSSLVTPGSGYAVLNEDGEILYRSSPQIPSSVYDSAWNTFCLNGEEEFSLKADGAVYLANYRQAQYGIQLLFLTPNSDILANVRPLLATYSLIFAGIALVILAVIYLVAEQLSRPLIRFSTAVAEIRDTRTCDLSSLHVSNEKELMILEKSFCKLIKNVNGLIEDIRIQDEKEKRSQLRALQAQINPHFIFNAMDMVNWLSLSRGCDDIAEIVSSIASLMRYSITDADSMVPVTLELENIREFISIYQLRHNNRPILQADLQSETLLIPKFTLQPLVENAVRHAVPPQGEDLRIDVKAWLEGELSIIEVHDNGTECSADELNRHLNYEKTDLQISSGFGIRNVNERIGLRFGAGSNLSYRNEADGSLTARITLHGSSDMDTQQESGNPPVN